ncbi:MAG: hypothetical protein NTW04_00775 [Elusimicrobia bacterium]|nr:hypothetical protein [Elusimicrobiota bacterium]
MTEQNPNEIKADVNSNSKPAARSAQDIAAIFKMKLAATEKMLSHEREKLLMLNMKMKQEEVFNAKVETSLREIQQRITREQREKEIEENRSELKDRVKDIEGKLLAERESWIQILRSQLLQNTPAQTAQTAAVGENLSARLAEMENRWREERERIEKTLFAYQERKEVSREREYTAQLEAELKKQVEQKDALTQEIARIKASLSELEKQGQVISQVTDSVKDLRNAVETLGERKIPTADEIIDRDAVLKDAQEKKFKAISAAIKLKKTVARLRVISITLEEEVRRLTAKNRDIERHSAAQTIKIAKLREDLAASEEKYKTDIAHLTQKLKALPSGDFTGDIEKMSGNYRARMQYLEGNIGSLEAKYGTEISSLIFKLEQKDVEAEELSEKIVKIEREYNAKISELENFGGSNYAAVTELEQKLKSIESKYVQELSELGRRLGEKNVQAREISQRLDDAGADYQTRIGELENLFLNLEARHEEEMLSLRRETEAENAVKIEQEIAKINVEHEAKVEEMRLMLKSQSDAYTARIEEMRLSLSESDGQLREAEQLKQELEHERGKMAVERKLFSQQMSGFISEKNEMSANLENLTRQKGQLDKLLKFFQDKADINSKNASELRSRVQSLENAKKEMETEFSRQKESLQTELEKIVHTENKLKSLLAHETAMSSELKRKLERYEKSAKNLISRVKWVLFGKDDDYDD